MNVGKVKLYITEVANPLLGYVTVGGVTLMAPSTPGTPGKPILGTGFAPLRLRHGDSIRIDIVDPEQEKQDNR